MMLFLKISSYDTDDNQSGMIGLGTQNAHRS
jgi:hypothetical protein